MKTNLRIPVLLMTGVLSVSLSLGACKKKEEVIETPSTTDTEQATSEDNNRAESYVTDIESIGSEVAEKGTIEHYKEADAQGVYAATCATVSGYGTSIITVDFGNSCVGLDGRTRSGKLIYDFSASSPTTAVYYRNPGFNMQVSSQNYVVDGYSVNIVNKQVRNTTPSTIPSGVNPGTNLTWSISANVSIVKPNNAGTITWSCNRTKELTNTSDTSVYRGQSLAIVWSKAIVKLNGTSNGVNARNENYTAVATNLLRDFTCAPDASRPRRHPFISGTVAYSPGQRLTRTINYGTGTCDMQATISIGNSTYTVTLP